MTSSNTNKFDQNKSTKHSDPITISPSASFRRRSASISSSSSSSGSSPETPVSGMANSQRINIPSSPSTSPILSYFLAQSPGKNSATGGVASTFPFKRKFGSVPVYEDEEPEQEKPVAAHARRASATVAGRLLQNPPLPDHQHERGANTLRRLSLSSGFIRPQVSAPPGRNQSPPPLMAPPNSAISPTQDNMPFQRKPARSATICNDGRKPRRAPSPMGERILKGHFDGFN